MSNLTLVKIKQPNTSLKSLFNIIALYKWMKRNFYANHRNKDEKADTKGFNTDSLANNTSNPHTH